MCDHFPPRSISKSVFLENILKKLKRVLKALPNFGHWCVLLITDPNGYRETAQKLIKRMKSRGERRRIEKKKWIARLLIDRCYFEKSGGIGHFQCYGTGHKVRNNEKNR